VVTKESSQLRSSIDAAQTPKSCLLSGKGIRKDV
jgi:hypothetical protein